MRERTCDPPRGARVCSRGGGRGEGAELGPPRLGGGGEGQLVAALRGRRTEALVARAVGLRRLLSRGGQGDAHLVACGFGGQRLDSNIPARAPASSKAGGELKRRGMGVRACA